VPGKGSFVKPAVSTDNTARLQSLENELARIIAKMLYLGMPPEEIVTRVNDLLSKDKGGKMND